MVVGSLRSPIFLSFITIIMKHINALLNDKQATNLKKIFDLAVWEAAGKNKYPLTVKEVEELQEILS